MRCPHCGNMQVYISTDSHVESESRSCLWNLFMLAITGGLWLIWMLVRRRKESVITTTRATCQYCGYSWILDEYKD